ncbi:glycerate kinase [Salisediminibacterium beveridgei]|uniref:Glycerate kinase n=1 Tax=Salisediminibacterium beveridgei TaxID=632773 RepID=A0A1D7QXI3_9BACI|nr:glycerate kinase [Salisediminibacterium beveridgei]AOM83723.1 Glycerate kinase [Salisediminibacterium beveridgei]
MKIMLAPDSFKGSMTSIQAAEAMKKGIHRYDSNIEVSSFPLADGGEGTIDALTYGTTMKLVEVPSLDPLGREMTGYFAYDDQKKIAVIETAVASGLTLLAPHERNPLFTSTEGTGLIFSHAVAHGAKEIIIGIGGSASVDGGVGFLQGLGVRFQDASGQRLHRIGGQLDQIHTIDTSEMIDLPEDLRIKVATDVTNRLLGKEGAVYIFGPQKGMSDEDLPVYENGMAHFAELTKEVTGVDHRESPGSGAAGGLGFALLSYLDAELRRGFEMVAESVGIMEAIHEADLIMSGEGKLDEQTLFGKGPIGVATIAADAGKPVILFGGMRTRTFDEKIRDWDHVVSCALISDWTDVNQMMKEGPARLEDEVYRVMKTIDIGRAWPQR